MNNRLTGKGRGGLSVKERELKTMGEIFFEAW